MKRITFYTALFVVLFAGFQSCKLESEDFGTINASLFPTTAADAATLVTGCTYNILQSNAYTGLFTVATQGITISADLATDIGESAWQDVRSDIYYARWQTSNSYVTGNWGYAKYVSDITLNIDRISKIDMDEALKNRYIAELRCGRAFISFLLYDYYGPIPIADLETLKNPLEEKILPRATEEEMRTFIETDLLEAAKVLPYNYRKGDVDYGRFTKGLCQMLLMKLYMYTKEWDKAEAAGREIMKPDYGYELVSTYKDIFTLANEKNAETIYSSISKPGYSQHKWHPHCLPGDFPSIPPNLAKWGGYKIAWSFMDTFEPGDGRLETISTGYTGTTGEVHSEASDRGVVSKYLCLGAVPLKYEFDAASTGEDNQIDYIIYRYADAITLLSEAIVRKGNVVTQEAVDLLNMVRTRANLPAYTPGSFTDSRDFLDKLLLERAHEFYFEGCRRQDLIRDGSWVAAMQAKAASAGEITLANENRQRFPLPQWVIDEGKGIIVQNPGY